MEFLSTLCFAIGTLCFWLHSRALIRENKDLKRMLEYQKQDAEKFHFWLTLQGGGLIGCWESPDMDTSTRWKVLSSRQGE